MQWYDDEENCGEKKNKKLLCTFMPNNIGQATYLKYGDSDWDLIQEKSKKGKAMSGVRPKGGICEISLDIPKLYALPYPKIY